MSMFGTDEQRKWVLEKLGDSAKLASEKLGEAQVLASQAIADAKLSERAATLAGTASEAIANAKLSERAATAAGSASEMLANAKLGERAATLAAGVNHLVTPLAKRLGADEVLASVRKQGADILTAYARALSEALGLHGVSARITYYATPTTPPLSKAGVSAGGVAATVVVTDALAESAKFAELAALEAAKGQRLVAERLIAGFALAAANPTAQEVKVSLTCAAMELQSNRPKMGRSCAPALLRSR